MRTTIRLADDLLAEAKAYAAASQTTLTAVVEDALRSLLAIRERAATEPLPKLPVYGQGGLLPGVDIDRWSELLDVMESKD